MQTNVITITEKSKWNHLIFRCQEYDFYHCHSYCALEQSGRSFLFTVTDDRGGFIAFPLVSRPIPGTTYNDCTSVYGYPGPVSNKTPDTLSLELLRYFHVSLLNFFEEEKIVAAFSRLHPLLDQERFLSPLGEVLPLNKTVAIDLTLSPELQRQQFNRTNKRHLNRLHRTGYIARRNDNKADIDAFSAIYHETMRRVNATDAYFFDEGYFHHFLQMDDIPAFLMLAYKDNEIAAGAIFTVTNHIMQYHLSGTKATHLPATPMKLIIDEARLLGTEMGLKYLHLGGGVGGSDTDSLYRFKSSFSGSTFTYKVWRMIVNEPVYKELVGIRSREKSLVSTWFPLYRG
jgi:hypothetical protein